MRHFEPLFVIETQAMPRNNLCVLLVVWGSSLLRATTVMGMSISWEDNQSKAYKICSVSGGLDVVRLVSGNTRNFFRSALEDVEFIREYVSEAALNGGIVGGNSDK